MWDALLQGDYCVTEPLTSLCYVLTVLRCIHLDFCNLPSITLLHNTVFVKECNFACSLKIKSLRSFINLLRAIALSCRVLFNSNTIVLCC